MTTYADCALFPDIDLSNPRVKSMIKNGLMFAVSMGWDFDVMAQEVDESGKEPMLVDTLHNTLDSVGGWTGVLLFSLGILYVASDYVGSLRFYTTELNLHMNETVADLVYHSSVSQFRECTRESGSMAITNLFGWLRTFSQHESWYRELLNARSEQE